MATINIAFQGEKYWYNLVQQTDCWFNTLKVKQITRIVYGRMTPGH